jgi:hypothetical protein
MNQDFTAAATPTFSTQSVNLRDCLKYVAPHHAETERLTVQSGSVARSAARSPTMLDAWGPVAMSGSLVRYSHTDSKNAEKRLIKSGFSRLAFLSCEAARGITLGMPRKFRELYQ